MRQTHLDIKNTISYAIKLCEWYENVLKSDEGVAVIKMLNEMYGDKGITDLKKLDLVLWQMRS